MDRVDDLASAFRAAIERGDADAATALFAPDCVFNSPIVHRPYVGPAPLRAVLGAVLQVFADFRYTGAYSGERVTCWSSPAGSAIASARASTSCAVTASASPS